jgi:PIN domain nuclease of toxin-antitoxin system
MKKAYVLDACALIAVLSKEDGADKVMTAYYEAVAGNADLLMNKINLLEVYYHDYRTHGKDAADNMIGEIAKSPIKVVSNMDDDVFYEAGRLKATYKMSLADSVVLAQAEVSDATILTADHHEFDAVEANEDIQFLWIR